MRLDQFARQRREAVPPDEVRRRLVVSVSNRIETEAGSRRRRIGVYALATGFAATVLLLVALDMKKPRYELPAASSAYFASTIQLDNMTAIMLVAESDPAARSGR